MGCKPSSSQNQEQNSAAVVDRGLTFLPRDDPNPAQRTKDIAEARAAYAWAYKMPDVPPYVPKIPKQEKTDATAEHRMGMFKDVIKTSAELKFNRAIDAFKDIFVDSKPFDQYEEIFDGSSMSCPSVSKRWKDDAEFARQRLVGCNPTLIRRVDHIDGKVFTKVPLKDEELSTVLPPGYTVARLVAEKRMFVCDYEPLAAILDKCPPERFTTAPVAFFFSHPEKANALMPLAIQLSQAPSPQSPIFTPADPPGLWMVAKIHCQVADANLHEVEAHLFATHIVQEAVYVAMRRNLHVSHPLLVFLGENFFYTIHINVAARNNLIAPEGPVPRLMSIGYPGTVSLFQEAAKTWDWKRYDIPLSMTRRGLDDKEILPENYWRDDALKLWKVIADFVDGMIDAMYRHDAEVAEDAELQAFIATLTAPLVEGDQCGCNFKGLPIDAASGKMLTLAQLKKFCTMVLYAASAGHSAVNNGQFDYLAYIPNSPGTFKLAPPTSKAADVPVLDIARAMPDLSHTQLQITFVSLLSQPTDDVLGSYNGPSWRRPDLANILQGFKKDLTALSEDIAKRNATVKVPYIYLDPKQIAQGIAI